jgi:hypothetical protein
VALGVAAVLMVGTGVMWLGIRTTYRKEIRSEVLGDSRAARLERLGVLSEDWVRRNAENRLSAVDAFVDRLWAIHYPALAMQRVPAAIPHEEGAILWTAIEHILTPRVFFPDKDDTGSDSDMVRKYAGVWVAGDAEATSIAFGYAGEAYVDFGLPWMFVPVFVYGLFMGIAYRWWLRTIRNRELAVALVTTVFWLSLYLFERSWIKTLGLTGTLMIYLGGVVIFLDRYVLARRHPREKRRFRWVAVREP